MRRIEKAKKVCYYQEKDGIILLSKNLKYLRLKHGYSQEYIAKYTHKKSFTTVQKWESGVAEPTLAVVWELSKLYHVPMDTLYHTDLAQMDMPVHLSSSTMLDTYPFIYSLMSLPDTIPVDVSSYPKQYVPPYLLGPYSQSCNLLIITDLDDSMNQLFPSTAVIVLEQHTPAHTIQDGDILVLFVKQRWVIRKVFCDTLQDQYILRPYSTNPMYTDILLSAADFMSTYILGKVVTYTVIL